MKSVVSLVQETYASCQSYHDQGSFVANHPWLRHRVFKTSFVRPDKLLIETTNQETEITTILCHHKNECYIWHSGNQGQQRASWNKCESLEAGLAQAMGAHWNFQCEIPALLMPSCKLPSRLFLPSAHLAGKLDFVVVHESEPTEAVHLQTVLPLFRMDLWVLKEDYSISKLSSTSASNTKVECVFSEVLFNQDLEAEFLNIQPPDL